MDNTIEVFLFGEFKMCYQGITLSQSDIHSDILTKYLTYLLYNYKDVVKSQRLDDVLWMGEDLANPKNTIKNLMYRLRKLLKTYWPNTSFWLTRHNGYVLNPQLNVVLDTS